MKIRKRILCLLVTVTMLSAVGCSKTQTSSQSNVNFYDENNEIIATVYVKNGDDGDEEIEQDVSQPEIQPETKRLEKFVQLSAEKFSEMLNRMKKDK